MLRRAALGLSRRGLLFSKSVSSMARRNEDFARLGSHGGGYTQALTVGKGFSGSARSAAKQQGGTLSKRGGGGGGSGGGGGGGNGTMNAYARHQELIRNYHRYHLNARVPTAGAIEAKGLPGQRRLTDEQALRRQHRFVRDQAEDHRAHEVTRDVFAWRVCGMYYECEFLMYVAPKNWGPTEMVDPGLICFTRYNVGRGIQDSFRVRRHLRFIYNKTLNSSTPLMSKLSALNQRTQDRDTFKNAAARLRSDSCTIFHFLSLSLLSSST